MLSKVIIQQILAQIYTVAYNQNEELEYILCDTANTSIEAVFLARIDQVNSHNGLAFISYTENKTGIINLDQPCRLQAGSLLECQMLWVGDEVKGAKFRRQIKLIGKYVILGTAIIGQHFSKALVKPERLVGLREKYTHSGIVFRHSIDNLSDLTVVEAEIELLLKEQQRINLAQTTYSKPVQLTCGTPKYLQLLRNLSYGEKFQVITNTNDIFEQLKPYVNLWQINELHLNSDIPLDIDELTAQLNTNLVIKDGISLSIHQLSGINLIDVNSQNIKLSFYKINYLALEEIVKQIKLRDLTGIILIDFIKNMTNIQQQNLLQRLTALLANDWRLTRVLDFTSAGICEIIRNK